MRASKARILIVDDDASFSASIAARLEHAHYDVTRARSRLSSLTMLLDIRFDIVLLDLNLGMGDFEGVQVIDGARKAGIRVPPIIVMSGNGEDAIAAAATALGTDLYIRKPFSGEALEAVIEQALHPPRTRRNA